MSIKDCREGVESITVICNMEDGTMKTDQNGVLKIAENEAADSIIDNNIKRPRKLTEKGVTIQFGAAEDKDREDQC